MQITADSVSIKKLSVNVNKIATLRNSRGGDLPNVVEFSRQVLDNGADGITVHPRPDGRHIRDYDVKALAALLATYNQKQNHYREFNIEGYPDQKYMQLVKSVHPDQCTLVPDPPEALTSNAGWNLQRKQSLLKEVIQELHSEKIRVSLFIDVEDWTPDSLNALTETGADRIELYTEAYAKAFGTPKQSSELQKYASVAAAVSAAGFGVNAGHDLNSKNLSAFAQSLPSLLEVSIGHAFISECLYWGLPKTTQMYLQALKL